MFQDSINNINVYLDGFTSLNLKETLKEYDDKIAKNQKIASDSNIKVARFKENEKPILATKEELQTMKNDLSWLRESPLCL